MSKVDITPEALNGYGLERKAILDELSRRNWLALDPMSPFRKVVEIKTGSGEKWKVIRLQPLVMQLMGIADHQSESAPPANAIQQACATAAIKSWRN
jgi:hypothetical protein